MTSKIILTSILTIVAISFVLGQGSEGASRTPSIPKPQTFTFKVYKQANGPLGRQTGLPNANIRITTVSKSFKVRTDSSGKKVIKHLPNAHYTFEISHDGCDTVRKKLKRTFAINHLTVTLDCQ